MALVKYNNNSLSAVTSTAGMPAGAMTLIKSQTASSIATISFVDGTSDVVLDNTYPIYLFKFYNVHPATDNVTFDFNGSDDDSSHSYDVTKTSTFFQAFHNEAGSDQGLQYSGSADLAQGTGFQNIVRSQGNDTDQSCSGEMFLFSPSSTTFVKHFLGCANQAQNSDATYNTFFSGYFNTTADITAIQFKMSSGNIDAGTFKLYGIKDS